MTREELIQELKKLQGTDDLDLVNAHIRKDELLLEYINDEEITKEFEEVGGWYE